MMLDCLKGINFKKTGIIKQRCKETLYKWNGSGA